jgi:hypothetical protein
VDILEATMKKVLILCAAMTLAASSAFALGGIDISFNACPGNSGAIGDVIPIDCASGAGLTLLGTWGPAENITDLVALDGIMDLYVATGLDAATFWDSDPTGCNAGTVITNQARPAAGCATPTAYTASWSPAGSGTAVANFYPDGVRNHTIRLSFTCYRPSLLSVVAGQKLFGLQVFFDGTNAAEAGGSCAGCGDAVSFAWNEATPGSASGVNAPAHLTSPTGNFPGFSNCTGISAAPNCAAVPTKKRTWGQLKSLYR